MPQQPATAEVTELWSHERTVERFDSPRVAAKYPAAFGKTLRERRERACLKRALSAIAPGSHVLDLPCGAGRLTRLLVEAGMNVTAADSSPHMVEQARRNWETLCEENIARRAGSAPHTGSAPDTADHPAGGALRGTGTLGTDAVRFEVRDAMATGCPDRRFDAVFCNRLFHHFNESETRVAVLSELRRITRGVIVVSFFNSFALDAVRFRLKHLLRGTRPVDRIPIPMRVFAADVERAGLEIASRQAIFWGLSPMWYVIARPRR